MKYNRDTHNNLAATAGMFFLPEIQNPQCDWLIAPFFWGMNFN
jgi:hypothetical protein